jgi:hypothetical protein
VLPYGVFSDIHFLDQQLLVDDVQLMDHDSKRKVDNNKQIFLSILLDQYLGYFEEYQLLVHIVLFSYLTKMVDNLHLHP